MNISNSQIDILRRDVRAGLRALFRPEPQTAVEWADANYYLPKESAYQEGRWETLPFQRAIMNAMGSDYIREVNVVKSARVGYSKMLLGVYAYFIEHKQRNTLNRRIPGAFIQQLKNGRWHVMQRVAGKNRYPIDVVKIPMAVPLTTAFKQNIERIRRERLPKELGYALQHQLRMVIKR